MERRPNEKRLGVVLPLVEHEESLEGLVVWEAKESCPSPDRPRAVAFPLAAHGAEVERFRPVPPGKSSTSVIQTACADGETSHHSTLFRM